MYLVFFIAGYICSYIFMKFMMRKNTVGSLVIDVVDPYNDQPFLMELHTDVNTVYNKPYIVLNVRTQK